VLFARARDTEHSVMADIGLGDALSAQADFAEAARIYSRARMRAGQHGLPLMQALADESMALLDLARGAYDAALAGLERARRSYAQLALPQHSAIAEKQLADAYLALHLLPEALALYDRTLQSMATLDMPDDRAWTALQRGRALSNRRG
jgi:tetratricopeptide (TPR) repeat protein